MGFFNELTDFIPGMLGGLRDDDRNARAAADSRQADERGAERQMAFQTTEASTARGWMERMSNSAHQREIADLRAAGLNPVLSGTGGMGSATPGASAPGGSKAGAALQSASSTGLAGVSTAMALRRNREEINNIRGDTDLKLSMRDMTYSQAKKADQETANAVTAGHILRDQRKGTKLEGEIDESRYGEIMRYIERALGTVNSAGSASRLFRQR